MRKLLKKVNDNFKKPVTEEELIKQEATIGGQIFGHIPSGRTRQFFCLDENTWVWYEAWYDNMGEHKVITRYTINNGAIYKSQNNSHPELLSGQELTNFSEAVRTYKNVVAKHVYGYNLA